MGFSNEGLRVYGLVYLEGLEKSCITAIAATLVYRGPKYCTRDPKP